MSEQPLSSYRFALYVRKSSESEDRQVLSIESQIEHLQEYAQKNRILIRKIYEDSASAHKPDNRPQFTQMLKDIHRKKIDGILCWKADRLARNLAEGGEIIQILQTHCLKIITTPYQSYFPQSNMLMLTIEFGVANQYSLDLSKNVKRGNTTKLKAGGWCGVAPVGYLNDRINKTIIKDPERFHYVRKIFQLYQTGNYSMADLCTIARDKWDFKSLKRSKSGGKHLVTSTLYQMLKNPFYAGWVRSGGVVAKGKHTPIITPEEFEKIQKLLARKTTRKYKLNHAHILPYKGLMVCKECGGAITAQKKTKYKCPKCGTRHCSQNPKQCSCGHMITQETIKNGKHYFYYHCTKKKGCSKIGWAKCKQPYVSQQNIEDQIQDYISQLTPFNQPFIYWVSENLSRQNQKSIKLQSLKINELRQQTIRLDQKIENLIQLAIDGSIDSEELKTQRFALEQKKEHIHSKIIQLNSRAKKLDVEKTCKQLQALTQQFKNLPATKKKQILQKVGSNHFLNGKNLLLDWHPAIQLLLELRVTYNGRIEPLVCSSETGLRGTSENTFPLWQSKWDELRTHLQDFDLPNFEFPDTQS